jgi:hypothetical protein
MIESNHVEERLARVERMLAQCQKESVALKAIAASKVVMVMVKAAPFQHANHPRRGTQT